RICAEGAPLDEGIDRVGQGHEPAGDRRGARTAVGLQHVAVDGDGALSQALEVNDRAQRAADQPLNLLRAPRLLAARGLARRTGVRGSRQHAVLRGDPTLARAAQERGHTLLDTGGAEHARRAETDQHRAFCMGRVAALEAQGPQFVRRPAAWPKAHAARQRSAAALVLSLYGADAATAWVPSSVSASRRLFPAVCANRTRSWSR